MEVPPGRVERISDGGSEALRQILSDLHGMKFNGVLRTSVFRGDVPSQGVLVFRDGDGVLAEHRGAEDVLGATAVPEILRDASSERAQIEDTVTARVTRDILVPMAAPALAVSAVLIFSSMLASFSIPLMLGRGSGAQMLMIDVYYRFGQHGDFETASALGVVSYLLAMGAALVYVRRLTR